MAVSAFHGVTPNQKKIKQKIQSRIKDAETERHAKLSSKQLVSTKTYSQSRSSWKSKSKGSSRSLGERRALEERIKMVELMTEAEFMEKRQPLEFEIIRIQLAAKSKAQMNILQAPSEVPDDA